MSRTCRDTGGETPGEQRGQGQSQGAGSRWGLARPGRGGGCSTPDLGDWGPRGHLSPWASDSCSERRGLSAWGPHAPHRLSPAVLGTRWQSSRRPLSGVGVLVMTGVLAAVATLTLQVWPPYPCSDCGIQTGAGGGVDRSPPA